MSTNSECLVVEKEPGQWFYVLERSNAPKNAFDWLDYADTTGPFKTEDEAVDHLLKFNANPGGLQTKPFDAARPLSDRLKAAVAKAKAPRRSMW